MIEENGGMNKKIYNLIYGCPKHGNKNGKIVTLKTKENGVEIKKPCFCCEACNKAYIEPSTGEVGNTKHRAKNSDFNMEIWNTIGPYKLPSTIFVYNKNSGVGLCSCTGSLKKKTKAITHFLLPDGSTLPASGAKVCKKCKRVFITKGMLKSIKELKTADEDWGVRIIGINDVETDEETDELDIVQDQEEVSTGICFEDGWENSVFEFDETDKKPFSVDGLKPANKVASAYYDAKINFNPYQYLPWLKMFVNEENKLLISDEVGLGKTIEAGILIMEELAENPNGQILVVCPAFLREKWYQELKEKFLIEAQVYDGKTAIDGYTNVVILPISRLKQYLDTLSSTKFDMIVVDEIHYFKNASSRRYFMLKHLLDSTLASKYVFMSATPVNNSGNDYHAIENLFGCVPDRTNTTKKQAYIELPERHIRDVYIDLTLDEQRFYDSTDRLDPFSGTIYRHIGASCLYALSKYAFMGDETSETKEDLQDELREAMEFISGDVPSIEEKNCFESIKSIKLPETDSKLNQLCEIIGSYENGKKIVIFSHYIETVKYVYFALTAKYNVGYIYANTISNNIPCRHAKNRFEDAKTWFDNSNDKITILICSDSCREGIDLDAATVLINYDLPFNPSVLEQRIGRIDRMSQRSDMEIYNFHVNNTYDDRLHFILNTKLRFINFYADYGIGNPLNISAEGNSLLNSFIRYFGKQIEGTRKNALMSNEDFSVASRLLRKIGINIEKQDDINALKMQAILLDRLNENQEEIIEWFDKGEIKRLTDGQLRKQRDNLEKILGFPKRMQRKIVLDLEVIKNVVLKANSNALFRTRVSPLIKNYSEKLEQMEMDGKPMVITVDDFKNEYVFGVSESNFFVPSSVIEIMRKEGAKVYEINS